MTANSGAVFVQEVPEQARKEFERGSELLEKTDQRREGVETLKKAIEIFPLYFAALELLGTEYVKQQEYEPAIPVLTKANRGQQARVSKRTRSRWHNTTLSNCLKRRVDETRDHT